ncbi:hypothetical protein AMTRI_Chr09g41170 [Amborella trichopoda]
MKLKSSLSILKLREAQGFEDGEEWKGPLRLGKKKVDYLHFYFHDMLDAKNPTPLIVAEANITQSSPTLFGMVRVMDQPLTEGPNLTSKMIGKAQGIFASVSQTEPTIFMEMNFLFTEGKFNGSELTVVGRNPILNKVREMSVVGGNGVFRLARGYAHLRTYSFNATNLNAIMEYHVTVIHY